MSYTYSFLGICTSVWCAYFDTSYNSHTDGMQILQAIRRTSLCTSCGVREHCERKNRDLRTWELRDVSRTMVLRSFEGHSHSYSYSYINHCSIRSAERSNRIPNHRFRLIFYVWISNVCSGQFPEKTHVMLSAICAEKSLIIVLCIKIIPEETKAELVPLHLLFVFFHFIFFFFFNWAHEWLRSGDVFFFLILLSTLSGSCDKLNDGQYIQNTR